MSLQQSYLSQPGYGYDTVVAVDQSGLNGVLKTYYQKAAPKFTPVTMYFIKDSAGNAQAIDLSLLLAKTNNIDPLKVNSTDTIGINALKSSPFYFAFTFTPGDPEYTKSYTYLKFIPGTQNVIYTLCCSAIQLAFFDTDNNNIWVNESQTTVAYNINSTITLQNILNNDNLPAAVQQELHDMGNAGLSVYQLLFDFDTAVVDPSTTIPVLSNDNSIFQPLVQQFIPAYFNAFNAVVSPVLNYSITQPNSATLMPTSMNENFGIEQMVDTSGNVISNPTILQQNASTLNYFFATGDNGLPAPKQFNWNWLELTDTDSYNGAIAINRNAFANYFHNQLKNYVLGNCWIPVVSAGNLYTGEYNIDIQYGNYLPGGGVQPFNAVNVEMGFPDTLLQYLFNSEGSATGWSSGDTMTVQTHFQLQLNVALPPATEPFLATTLTLTQSLWVLVNATGNTGIEGHTPYNGSPVKKTFIDTLNVIVDNDGIINLTNVNAQVQDESDSPNAIPQYVADALGTYVKWASADNFTQVPLTFPKQFVFPGGTPFTFKTAGFSQNSDLVAFITYNAVS